MKLPLHKRRTIVALSALLFVINYSFSQELIIASQNLNIAYLGIDNPIAVMIGNSNCDELEVYVDNGLLEELGNCKFNYKPAKAGKAIFKVYYNNDTLYNQYRILWIPETKINVSVGGILSPKIINKNSILAQMGLIATFDDFYFPMKVKVIEYTFILCSNDNYYVENVKNNYITNAIKEAIKNTVCIDKIIFDNIKIEINDTIVFDLSKKT
jgi:hypothetical protein